MIRRRSLTSTARKQQRGERYPAHLAASGSPLNRLRRGSAKPDYRVIVCFFILIPLSGECAGCGGRFARPVEDCEVHGRVNVLVVASR